MKHILFFIILIFSLTLFAQEPTRVLFIGNSLTYYNNMPETFENIANEKGDLTEVTVYAPGGTGFVHHAVNTTTFEKFREGNWDYVVLQPGSNESPGYSYPINETLERSRILTDSFYTYNPCAKVLFYEISYGVYGNSAENLATYNETMTLIRSNLTQLADSTQTFFAPVGEAFRTQWNSDQTNMLWGSNGDIHPNPKGSYIAACIFYASIFQKESFGTPIINGLDEAEASNFQTLADTTVLNHLEDWRVNTYSNFTNFEFIENGTTLNFTNLSQNYDSLLWDFGDDNFSTEENPLYTFSNLQSQTITLTSYKNGCHYSVSKTTATSSINELNTALKLIVYPNPAKDFINVKNASINSIFLIKNLNGRTLKTSTKTNIDVNDLPNGIYFLICLDKHTSSKQVIKWVKTNI